MTREEAVAWLDEHEADPNLPVTEEELRKVLEALTEPGVGISQQPDVIRARAIAQRADLTPTVGQGAITDAEGNQALPAELDEEFVARFFDAAEAAGVDETETQTILRSTLDQTTQFGGDPEGLLLPLIADWEEQAAGQRGRPIGVPDDFVAQRQITHRPGDIGLGGPGSFTQTVEPRYFDGDQYSPAGQSPEEIMRIQKRLETAGLLDSYLPGLWDSETANAYTEVLAAANRRGSTADAALDFMVSNPVEQPKEEFQPLVFPKPDYATLAQDVKSVMRGKLGREPTEQEMAELTGAMASAYRAGFEADEAARRSQFEAEQAGLETGEAVTPAAVQDVDPQARFAERFEARFGPEIDRLAALPETRENMNNVFASLRTMGSLIG